MIRRVASVLLFGGLMTPGASAQTGPGSTAPTAPHAPATAAEPARAATTQPAEHAAANRSIIRHNPLPRRTSDNSYYPYGHSESTQPSSGYSTGGVGRYAEFYDPNTPTSQVDQHPVPVARFESGGGPDRNEQIAAQQAGQGRARNIQNNINAYGTPYGAYGAGFGYGLGLGGGGRLYGFPN